MDLAELSDDDLIDHVQTWAARVARGDARLCTLIGELDTREVWAQHGVTSCAAWLSWKLGWSRTTSRERVRVGRALRELPLISEAFEAGRVTYSQVRAITRAATVADEYSWLDLARHCTGEQLDKAARGADRARAADRDPAERPEKTPVHKEWDEDGDLILTLRIPAHQAVPVLVALEQLQRVEQTEREEKLAALVADLSSASAEALSGGEQLELAAAPEAAPRVDHGAEALVVGSVEELLAAGAARRLAPTDLYTYAEPPFPLAGDRMFGSFTSAEQERVDLWSARRDRERAIRDAWNDRRDRLLLEASARRLPTGRASLADALVRAVLRPADCPPVTVSLLHDPVTGWARTPQDEFLPPATLAQVLETLPRKRTRRGSLAIAAPVANDPDTGQEADLGTAAMTRYDLGRTTRDVSQALRRLLGALDGERCRFPGCTHTRYLHAHHIQWWSQGGPTDLANLALLCTKHHRLLHNAGYVLTLDPQRNLTVTTPDGVPLEHNPELPSASAEALPPADATTLDRAHAGDRFDLGYVVHTMLNHAA